MRGNFLDFQNLYLLKGFVMTLSVPDKNFYDNYRIVEIDSLNHIPRCYKVPQDKTDSFQQEYKKNQKKSSWITNGLMLFGIIKLIIPVYFLTRKLQNNTLKTIIGVSAGLVGGFIGTKIGNKIEAKNHTSLLKKYRATEIAPSASPIKT